jgi:hypothetical protein
VVVSRGRAIILLARTALVLALIIAVVGWWQLDRLNRNVGSAVTVAANTSASVAQTISTSALLARQMKDLTSSVATSLDNVDGVLASAAQAGSATQTALSHDLPTALEGLSATADRLASAGAGLARVISILPGNQNTAFADELSRFADGIRPLPGELQALAGPVGNAVAAMGPLQADLSTARTQLEGITASMDTLAARLDQLAQDANRASTQLSASARRNTSRLFWWRLLLVLAVLVVIAFAAGLELLGRDVEAHATLHDARPGLPTLTPPVAG